LHVRLTDAGHTGHFVIQANVKKSAKMNAVPTQIHILPVSPVPESLTPQPYTHQLPLV
jgi:hypothetical protein